MSESATQLALSLEDPEPERWLPAVGYEGFYEVSDLGRVRSVLHQTIRGIGLSRYGYFPALRHCFQSVLNYIHKSGLNTVTIDV